MAAVVVVGTQWGDEGKGKITDFLSKKADAIARFAVRLSAFRQDFLHSFVHWY